MTGRIVGDDEEHVGHVDLLRGVGPVDDQVAGTEPHDPVPEQVVLALLEGHAGRVVDRLAGADDPIRGPRPVDQELPNLRALTNQHLVDQPIRLELIGL